MLFVKPNVFMACHRKSFITWEPQMRGAKHVIKLLITLENQDSYPLMTKGEFTTKS